MSSRRLASSFVLLLALACLLAASRAHAGAVVPAEYGDAPDGGLAYPGTFVVGKFPTCDGGPNGFVKHLNFVPLLYWGASVDFEFDGNASLCVFPPYNRDECGGALDVDAGLLIPTAFTIQGNTVLSCEHPQVGRALGPACGIAGWGPGQAIDLSVANNTGNDAWVNIVIDWNQDGVWSGQSVCAAGGPTAEWVVRNLPIPVGFHGALSALLPPAFRIGPDPGYVWARFTVHDGPPLAALDWDGSGLFDNGETEDYLLRIDPGDTMGELGDAPEGVLAYPPNGVNGQFPTCVKTGGFVWHGFAAGGSLFMGPSVDPEADGNHADCAFTNYDNDECGPGDGDAGLITPGSYTIVNGNYDLCNPGMPATVGQACESALWGGEIDVNVSNLTAGEAYLQVLADWDQDGAWTSAVTTCPPANTVTEQALLNFPIPSGFSGAISSLAPPPITLATAGYVWFRFSVTPSTVPVDWDGSGMFPEGETEDYLLLVNPAATGVPPATPPFAFAIERALPNPSSGPTSVSFRLASTSHTRMWIVDLAGRRIATLADATYSPGVHRLSWDGTRDDGRAAGPGIYLVRGEASGHTQSVRITRLR